jgi:hypothetical protein
VVLHPAQVSSDIFVVQSEITYHLPKACLEGRNLCTPPEATVEETAPGRFHVVLPAHLERGASIPNPAGALAMRNAPGRTWFSVNGGNFKTAEGYLEFDARLN